jgi:hypothetical protein
MGEPRTALVALAAMGEQQTALVALAAMGEPRTVTNARMCIATKKKGRGKEKEGSPRRALMSSARAPSRRFGFPCEVSSERGVFGLSRGERGGRFSLDSGDVGAAAAAAGVRGWLGTSGRGCSVGPARRGQGASGAAARAGWAAPGERSPVGRARWGFGWAARAPNRPTMRGRGEGGEARLGRARGASPREGVWVFLIFFLTPISLNK